MGISKDNLWHGFPDIEDNYVMLDPIKLTITTPGIDDGGAMDDWGIPTSILTNYLINHNMRVRKDDLSFLMLNSLGTTRAKQGTLLAAMLKFKEDFDANKCLCAVFPELVKPIRKPTTASDCAITAWRCTAGSKSTKCSTRCRRHSRSYRIRR
ncbi:MAG: hypothetical protein V8T87_01750 [Victivallales bacterium]